MKKLIIALVLTLNVSMCYSQDVYIIKAVSRGLMNQYKDGWIWGKHKETFITFTFTKNQISVTDGAKSRYTIIRDYELEYNPNVTQVAWEAKDEKYRDCVVKITKHLSSGAFHIYVMYYEDGIAFCYEDIEEL
jgi:hypothetical protein